MKTADPFYKSKKWETIRARALKRDEYMCQCCKANNQMIPAQCVHHIFPRDTYSQYQFELWNLMSLCNDCHDEMHNHYTGELSKKGMLFLRSLASVRGIPISMKAGTILVVGLPGTGKSSYCRQRMDEFSLCYDLDAIAGAFRLKGPHEEYFRPARKMANDFLKGFLAKAHNYCKRVYIIRTAPTVEELEEINPDKLVICRHQYVSRHMDDKRGAQRKIELLEQHCLEFGIEIEYVDRQPQHIV